MKIKGLRPLQSDPSRTVTLRRVMWSQLRKQYSALYSDIKEQVVDNDALGLTTKNPLANNEYWGYLNTPDKIDAFMAWLDGRVQSGLLSVDWHRGIIESAHKQGLGRAYQDAKSSNIVSIGDDVFSATRESFIGLALTQPQTIDTISVVFGQSYEALKGINASMATSIRSTLADHLVKGSPIGVVSKSLRDTVQNFSANRARLFAQTEIIRAHAEGQLDSFSLLGVEEVGALVEWSTAGDGRVCTLCNEMSGKRYKIKEARGLIPRHPGCRCTWVPYIPTE